MKAAETHAQALWRTRFGRYFKDAMGYWLYAARSNFIGFLIFIGIVSSYYYAKTLQHLPTNYPYFWLVALVLAPCLSISPIRTLLQSPDRIFLLRVEPHMGAYFKNALFYSYMLQAAGTAAALAALWPLYKHCTGSDAQPFPLMLLFLLLLKAASLLGSWQEARFAYGRARAASQLARWLAALLLLGLQFLHSLLAASAAALALVIVWTVVIRGVRKHAIGWEHLIGKEKQQQARLYAFFSWFVDVPQRPARISRRSWISGITAALPFRQHNAYLYLYIKTLLRTELFGMFLRVTCIGLVAVYALSEAPAKAIALAVAVFVSAVQLSSLHRSHQYTFWLDMYPLDKKKRAGSLALLLWCALIAQIALLTAPLLLSAGPGYAMVPLCAAGLVSLVCATGIKRKFQRADSTES